MFVRKKSFLIGIMFFVVLHFGSLFPKPFKIDASIKKWYQGREWAYIEKCFVEFPQEELKRFSQKLKKAFAFLLPAAGGYFITKNILKLSEKRPVLSGLATPAATGVAGVASFMMYLNHVKKRIDQKALEAFLDDYDPDLEKLGFNNNRLYIPNIKECALVESFDLMYERYKLLGKEFLYDNAEEMLKLIRRLIYEKDPARWQGKLKPDGELFDHKILFFNMSLDLTRIIELLVNKLFPDKKDGGK